jgi:predicted nucleotidyltransferase
MPYGLSPDTIAKIIGVLTEYKEVDEAVLYGSRAKGTSKAGSDIDLTLKGKKLNLTIINKISLEMDDLLLPYSFDLSIYHQISNPDLIEHIERVGSILYKKNTPAAGIVS